MSALDQIYDAPDRDDPVPLSLQEKDFAPESAVLLALEDLESRLSVLDDGGQEYVSIAFQSIRNLRVEEQEALVDEINTIINDREPDVLEKINAIIDRYIPQQ